MLKIQQPFKKYLKELIKQPVYGDLTERDWRKALMTHIHKEDNMEEAAKITVLSGTCKIYVTIRRLELNILTKYIKEADKNDNRFKFSLNIAPQLRAL